MSSAIVLGLLLVLLLGAAAAAWALAAVRRERSASEERADELEARMSEYFAAVRADQERVVDGVLTAAAARLDDRLTSSDRVLDLRDAAIEQQVESRNAEVGEQLRVLRSQLEQMTSTMQRLQEDRARQHGEFVTRLEQTAESQQALARTAGSLRDALANPKARGSWGERTADDLLRQLGFVENVSYRRQARTAAGTTPDFTFLLPEGRELNMDVKFPADNYLRYLEAENDLERERLRKAFLADVRNRMKELTDRSYIDPARTVDHLLLFIPNESIYSFIHEQEPGLVDLALSQKIILCSPFTLFGVMSVIRQAVDLFRLEQQGDEIHRYLIDFTQQWERFAGAIDDVDKKLSSLNKSFDQLNTTRRNQLQRQLDRIGELEAPAPVPEPLSLVLPGDARGERHAG